jgi:hypothetical protein
MLGGMGMACAGRGTFVASASEVLDAAHEPEAPIA